MKRQVRPSGFPSELIELAAVTLGEEHGAYNPEGCVDVEKIVHALGGTIRIGNYWANRLPLVVDSEASFIISVRSNTTKRYDRFSMAQQLGHLNLHLSRGEDFQGACFPLGDSNDAATIEAHRFAYGLLAPIEPFGRAYRETGGSTEALMDILDIGRSAIEARASMLHLR